MSRICSEVYDNDCTAPAGWGTSGGYAINTETSAKLTCYYCGEPVCASCSEVIVYRGRRCRLGKSCIKEATSVSAPRPRPCPNAWYASTDGSQVCNFCGDRH